MILGLLEQWNDPAINASLCKIPKNDNTLLCRMP